MNTKNIILSLIALFLLSGNLYSQNKNQSVYEQAGTIKLHDPKAVMVGYRQPGDDIFEISLDDVGKYTGHVCAGVSSAFILTKQALDLLYPNGEIPVRGQISIAASSNTDHLEVASYIVRARQTDPESNGDNISLVDTNIISEPGTVTLIFKRADSGKMVKAVFDKRKLLTPELKSKMMPLKKKVSEGTATEQEKAEFAKTVQEIVKLIITNAPKGLISASPCDNYNF